MDHHTVARKMLRLVVLADLLELHRCVSGSCRQLCQLVCSDPETCSRLVQAAGAGGRAGVVAGQRHTFCTAAARRCWRPCTGRRPAIQSEQPRRCCVIHDWHCGVVQVPAWTAADECSAVRLHKCKTGTACGRRLQGLQRESSLTCMSRAREIDATEAARISSEISDKTRQDSTVPASPRLILGWLASPTARPARTAEQPFDSSCWLSGLGVLLGVVAAAIPQSAFIFILT